MAFLKLRRPQEWQHAARLVIAAAEGGNVASAIRQLQFALMMAGKLDLR